MNGDPIPQKSACIDGAGEVGASLGAPNGVFAEYKPTPIDSARDALQVISERQYHREGLANCEQRIAKLDHAAIVRGMADLLTQLSAS